MRDLIIKDEEIQCFSEELQELQNIMEGSLSTVTDQLTKAYAEAVPSGDFHSNLEIYVEALKGMFGQMGYITEKIKKEADAYIQEIDEIDGELY